MFTKLAAFSLVGCVRALQACPVDALEFPELSLLFRQRRRGVVVERPRFDFGKVTIGDAGDGHCLFTSVGPLQLQLVADSDDAMRLGRLAVDFNLTKVTRSLRLGAGLVKARDVEPHIKPNGCIGLSHVIGG